MIAAGAARTGAPASGLTPPSTTAAGSRFLSDVIIELGFAERVDVERAVQSARSMGSTVGRVLVEMGRLTEEQLARATAERHGIPYIELALYDVDPAAANLIKPNAAKRYRAVPVGFVPAGLLVAMADPEDALGINDIALMTKLDVHPAVAAPPAIEALLEGLPLPSAADVAAPVNGGEDEAAVTSEDRGESGSGAESGSGVNPGSWGESGSGAESGSGVFWQADFEPPETSDRSPSSCARWSRRALRRSAPSRRCDGPSSACAKRWRSAVHPGPILRYGARTRRSARTPAPPPPRRRYRPSARRPSPSPAAAGRERARSR